MPSVCEGLIESRARGLLQLFQRKGLLPRALKSLAALADLDAVRTALDENRNNLATVNEAFICACCFEHEAVASLLLERSIALDADLGSHVDGSVGRRAFIRNFIDRGSVDFAHATAVGPWNAFVMGQVKHALDDDDLTAFASRLQREPWLLGEACVWFQIQIIGNAALNDREAFIVALLDLNPALLRRLPPPPSQAIEFAVTYANTHLIPVLTRVWPLPDDLAACGSDGQPLAGEALVRRVRHAFARRSRRSLSLQRPACAGPSPVGPAHGTAGARRGARLFRHQPSLRRSGLPSEHGADINTNWNSHEPASILHHLVFLENSYESMQFLIDRGIDLTIRDYRWNSTARGWALHGRQDQRMANWLEEAERQRKGRQ